MKILAHILAALLALLPTQVMSAESDPRASLSLSQIQAVAQQVLTLVNEARAERRRCGWKRFGAVAPLAMSVVLQAVALAHARDMADRGILSHAGRDGSTPGTRAEGAGYRWRVVGENIASGQATAEQVVADWLKSSHHCANLMDPDYSEMGVAFAVGSRSEARNYWSQMFAAPRTAS